MKKPREWTDAELVAVSMAIWVLGILIAAFVVGTREL